MTEINVFKNLLKEGSLSHVYLFVVQEEYEFRKLLDEIKQNTLTPGFEDFDFDRLDGKDTDLQGIIHTANTAPMASAKRLVIINNMEAVSDNSLEAFKNFVDVRNDNCLLLLVANETIPSKKWADLLLKKNLIVEFKKFDEKNIPGWIINYLKKKGYGITREASAAIASQIGDNLSEITHQLDKALLSIQKGQMIDEQMVYDSILRSKRHKFWELSDAAAEKNLSSALLLLNRMLEDGESDIALLGVINSFFKKLMNARYLLDSGLNQDEVCRVVGQKWYQKKFIDQVKRFDLKQLKRVSGFIRQADENIKTGYLSPKDNLERLLLNICGDLREFPKTSLV